VFVVHHQATEERRRAKEELQEFLACFKKERQSKVTQVKEAIFPSTSGKAKVTPDVSASSHSGTPEDVSSMLNDHNKHMTNQLKYMLEDGLVIFFKMLSTSPDPYSIPSNPQTPSSWDLHEPLDNPPYVMSKRFTPSQMPLTMSTLPPRPETTMVKSPLLVEPLNSIPSSATLSRTNELANFISPYQTVMCSTPPILPRGMGAPRGSV
jgi:hypothetical protein